MLIIYLKVFTKEPPYFRLKLRLGSQSQAVSTLQNYLEKAIKSYLYSRTYNITVSYIVNILTVSVSSITIFKNSE